MATITFNKSLNHIVDMMKYFNKTPEQFRRTDMPDYFDIPKTTLDDWLKDNV